MGTGDNLTISAFDAYGNSRPTTPAPTASSSPPTPTSPAGNAATVDNSSGTPVAFGTATPIVFTAGVSTVGEEGGNGELTVYKSGAISSFKATEGSITNTVFPSITVAPSTATNFGTASALRPSRRRPASP